jgi:hypothetical protein
MNGEQELFFSGGDTMLDGLSANLPLPGLWKVFPRLDSSQGWNPPQLGTRFICLL